MHLKMLKNLKRLKFGQSHTGSIKKWTNDERSILSSYLNESDINKIDLFIKESNNKEIQLLK